jgi:hypothetical protein
VSPGLSFANEFAPTHDSDLKAASPASRTATERRIAVVVFEPKGDFRVLTGPVSLAVG